jgi:hypothetical protein
MRGLRIRLGKTIQGYGVEIKVRVRLIGQYQDDGLELELGSR